MNIETAVILAAGKGTRLIPLTINRPKVLLPVGGIPLLKRQIDMLITLGVRNIVLVVNYRAESIKAFIDNTYANNDEVSFSFINQGKPLGTAHAVEVTEEYVYPPFIVLYGDIYTTYDVLNCLIKTLDHADAAIVAIKVPDPWNYGVFKVDDKNRIFDVIEKPSPGKEPSNLINGGIYAFRDLVIFDYIRKTGISPRGEKEFTDSIKYMARDYVIKATTVNREKWYDIGKPWDLLEANKAALIHSGMYVDSNADISDKAIIVPPVYIDENVKVESHARIGPYVALLNGVSVSKGASIRNSIVFENTKIGRHAIIEDSLIGANVVIRENVEFLSKWISKDTVWYRLNGKFVDSKVDSFGAVVGDHVFIAEHSIICPGVFIMPKRRVKGLVVDDII